MSENDVQELWEGTAERSVDGTTWTVIEKVQAVDVPDPTYEKRNRTSLDTVGNAKEFGKGRVEFSPFTMTVYNTVAGHRAAVADAAREYTWYRLTFASGVKVEAKCLVDYSTEDDLEGDSMITLTGTVTGEVTVTFPPVT